jgi:hypothetical protein
MFPFFRFSDNCRCKGDALWLGWRETQADDLASPGEAVLMPPTSESPAPVSGTSQKTLQLLRKRLRQLRRVTLALAIGLAVAATALGIWWSTSLNGLPDIGDPFDVAAFRAFRIPDDQNAFVFLRRAHEKLTPIRWGEGPHPDDRKFSWSIADPKSREWAGENREALELFLRAADQPDASHPAGEPTTRMDVGGLEYVVFLEGSRRQESGDTAGAWDCYRALLRMITHIRRRGNTRQRYSAQRASPGLQRRLTDWATDPRTTTPQLHTAMDEVLKNEPNPDWDISAIKYGYLDLMREIERPMPLSVQQEIEGEWTFGLGDMALSPTMIDGLEAARRFLLREPERSRRVLRLLCAHYLAHLETHELPPRTPAVWAKFSYLTSSNPVTKGRITVPLYPVSPRAPAGARALPPQAVAGWLVATLDARLRLVQGHSYEWPWPPDRVADRRGVGDHKAYRELVIMLATELYHRERGSLPSSEEALVGTYLKSLPDDRSPDVYDGTAPIVE